MVQIDIQMPTDCASCWIRQNMGCKIANASGWLNNKRDDDCPLKKQEAKQVIRKQCKKEWEDGSIDYYAEWYCPHCNSLILRGFDNPSIKFCYKCGKPILWEGR